MKKALNVRRIIKTAKNYLFLTETQQIPTEEMKSKLAGKGIGKDGRHNGKGKGKGSKGGGNGRGGGESRSSDG